jgi:hypothetical protein
MTVTSALSALLGALEGHDLAPDIHEAIADANAALMRDSDAGPTDIAFLTAELGEWARDPLGPSGTVLGGILARHGLVNVAEVERLREQVRQFESAFRTVDSELSSSQREAASLREQVAELDERPWQWGVFCEHGGCTLHESSEQADAVARLMGGTVMARRPGRPAIPPGPWWPATDVPGDGDS